MPLVRIRLLTLRPKSYPELRQTLGEHIKKRRLELGLTQRQAAAQLGVNPWTVLNWETGRHDPPMRSTPAVLRYLRYDPFPVPTTLAQRLLQVRRERGWAIREAGDALRVDPGTWRDWERGELILFRVHRTKVARLLGLDPQELADEMRFAGAKNIGMGAAKNTI